MIIACLLLVVLNNGILYPLGLVFRALLADADIGGSPAVIAAILAIQYACFNGAGIVAGLAIRKYGPRRTVLSGAALCVAGFGLSSVAPSAVALCVTQGVLAGCGASLVSNSATFTIAQHFVKRRGTALGIVLSGTGGGALLLAPIVAGLLEAEGWRGTLRVVAVLYAIAIPVASLPLHMIKQSDNAQPQPPAAGATASVASAALAEDAHAMADGGHTRKPDALAFDAALERAAANPLQASPAASTPAEAASDTDRAGMLASHGQGEADLDLRSITVDEPATATVLVLAAAGMTVGARVPAALAVAGGASQPVALPQLRGLPPGAAGQIEEVGLSAASATPATGPATDSSSGEGVPPSPAPAAAAAAPAPAAAAPAAAPAPVAAPMGYGDLLRMWPLMRFLLGLSAYAGTFFVVLTHGPAFAVEAGVMADPAPLLMVQGIANAAGRLLMGPLSDSPRIDKVLLQQACMLLTAVFTALLAFAPASPALWWAFEIVYGGCAGSITATSPSIVANILPPSALPLGLGLTSALQGPSILAMPPLIGWLKDRTGSYAPGPWMLTAIVMTGASIFVRPPRC